MDVLTFLKILTKMGYPNPSTVAIANSIDYDIDNFLLDLKRQMGEKGVADFCERAIQKLTGKKGLKVNLDGPNGDEYVYVHIYPIYYHEDESPNDIISRYSWGDSKVLGTDENGKEVYMTIQEIIDNTDMGGWAELDDLLDTIRGNAYNKVYQNCGFGIWWE